jgi:hypothetical protein
MATNEVAANSGVPKKTMRNERSVMTTKITHVQTTCVVYNGSIQRTDSQKLIEITEICIKPAGNDRHPTHTTHPHQDFLVDRESAVFGYGISQYTEKLPGY